MKKKSLIIGAIFALAVIGATNIDTTKPQSTVGLLGLNVEALATEGEFSVKIETCIGKNTPCTLSSGAKGIGKPVLVDIN